MTSTERIQAAIAFETPDRIPVWDVFRAPFVTRWHEAMGFRDEVDPHDHYGIDMSIHVATETAFPSGSRALRTEGEYDIRIDGWGRTLRVMRGGTGVSQQIAAPFEDPAQIDRAEFEPADLDSRYTYFLKHLADERAKGRCPFAKIGGIFIRTQFMRGEEALLMDMAGDSALADALFDRTAAHLTDMALETLRRGDLYDTGLFVYDDMAGTKAPVFSPAMFERYLLARYARLIDTVKRAGCRHVFFHSDGNIAPLLDLLLDAGFAGFTPLEPRCGLDLLRLRERYGRRMVFFGGMCNTRILPRGTRAEMEAHVQPLIQMGREGGLVLGSASISEDVRPAAYDRYMRFVRANGDY